MDVNEAIAHIYSGEIIEDSIKKSNIKNTVVDNT